jgi:hypothetical protein
MGERVVSVGRTGLHPESCSDAEDGEKDGQGDEAGM